MKYISNETYESALNNKDFIKIGRSVLKNFNFDPDTNREIWLYGLWDALQRHDVSKAKFTTYLHMCIYFRCLKTLNANHQHVTLIDAPVYINNNIEEILEILPEKYRKVIYDRIVGRMTFKELSEKYDKTYLTIRKYIKNGLNILKKEKNGV